MLISLLITLFGMTAVADDFPSVNTSALSEYDKNAPIGFGASATGSEDENPVTVTTLDDLTAALSGTDKKTIYVLGTITFTGRVQIGNVSNKTIYGLPGATFENPTHVEEEYDSNTGKPTETAKNASGILTLSGCSNIIIRNLTFKGAGAYDIDGYDNLTLSGCSNIWIDHCDFQDGVDGNLDCNNASDNICVSWCRFRYLIDPWSGGSGGSNDHRFSNLWSGGDNATADEGHLNTTFYACWWDEGCKQRMPRIRYGKVHILNCFYSSSAAEYCIGAGYRSNVYVEKSSFATYGSPWQCYAIKSGYTDYNIQLVSNEGAGDDIQSSGSIAQFVPSYNYTAMNASDVQDAVSSSTNGAGATLTYGQAATSGNLIDFPTSTTGITANGTTEQTTVEGYSVYKFSNSYTGGNAGINVALTVNGGFKTGDIVTVAGFIKNSNEGKYGTVTLFSATGETGNEDITNINQFENFANLANSETITEQSYTLQSDYDRLFLGRSGNTGTNLTVIKVVRPGASGGDEPENPETPEQQDFSITWSMANGASSTATTSINDVALVSSWAMSSKIQFNSTYAYGGNTITKFAPTEDHNPRVERNTDYYVEWTFKPYPGFTFTPSSVSFDAVKCGTGDPSIDVDFTDGTGVTQQLATNAAINRDGNDVSDTNPAINHSYSITTANNASGDAVTLRIYIGKIKTGKQVALGRIVINGQLSGSKASTETYTVTYANNDADAYGTAPAAVEVTQYQSTTIPTNRTLYKSGYTLTGWSDGTKTYAIGDDFTPTASVTLNPVFTANTKTLGDFATDKTVTWYFGKGNGAPDYDGSVNANVQQVNIGASTIDLGIKMAGGKNDDRTDEWMNNKQKDMMVPVVKGAVVKAKVYYTNNASFNGETITYDQSTHGAQGNVVYTYTYTGDEPAEIAVNVGNQFLSYISVTYPGSSAIGANFQDFAAIVNNQTGTLLTSAEQVQGTAVSFGVTVDSNGNTVRVAADDASSIATISGTYHSDHGCTGLTVVVPVPGPVAISVGQCTYSGNAINVKNSAGTTVISKTPAQSCWKNDHSKVTVFNYTGEATTLTISGMSYCPYIAVAAIQTYTVTGTIAGGNIDNAEIKFTSTKTGDVYAATITNSAFTLSLPADTYTLSLSNDVAYLVTTPESITVSSDGSIGTVTIAAAQPQTVTGDITNAPATAFTLTFTATNDASHTTAVNCAANATSFSTTLNPDTYVISSSTGTLSPLSVESFTVVKDAVTHNIYYPEAAVPAATQQNITVDNTLNTASANNYKTVTDALAAAKAGGISAPVITLTSGQTYREQVIVDIANVTFKTSGTEKATITFYYGIGYSYYSLGNDGYYNKDRAMTRNSIKMKDPSRWGATVLVKKTGSGFKAENVIFENSFNQYYTTEEVTDGVTPNGQQSITYNRTLGPNDNGYKAADSKAVTERAAALAFENNPTGCQLYNCVLRGSQDTFYTGSSSSLYVKDCNIIGNTDYIFGGGTVVFDNCDLTIGGYSDQDVSAYITANSPTDQEPYIFRDCTVKGSDRTYVKANLGRDWGGAKATVYYFNLKNEIDNKLSYTWNNMGGGVSDSTANLHIYDFDPTINANYNTTGATGANINGILSDDDALSLYANVVSALGFTPERIYEDALELGEASYYNVCRIAAAANAGNNVTRTVQLTRAIGADKWNTIVLPFDMTADQVTSTFGEGTKLAQLTSGSTADNLKFTTATEITANQPYAIKVPTAITVAEPVNISGVTIKGDEPTQEAGGWNFVGTYTKGNIPQESYFFSNNMLYQAADATNTIKAFRAWFTYNGANASRNLSFTIDDETTSISEELRVKGEESDGVIYDLQGRRVRSAEANSSLFTIHSSLKPGVYIVNGKCVIIK